MADGETMSIADLKAMYAEMDMEYEDGYIELLSGGKCKLFIFGESVDGTFKGDSKTIEVTADGDTMKGTIDGNKLTIDMGDGDKWIFEKAG